MSDFIFFNHFISFYIISLISLLILFIFHFFFHYLDPQGTALALNATISITNPIPLSNMFIAKIIEMYFNMTLDPLRVSTYNINVHNINNKSIRADIEIFILINQSFTNFNLNSTVKNIELLLLKKSKNISELKIRNITINSSLMKTLNYEQKEYSKCNNNGQNGTYYKKMKTSLLFSVLPTIGAENTEKALFLSNRGIPSNFAMSEELIISFPPAKPSRITFYARLQSTAEDTNKSNFGALFTIISRKPLFNTIKNGTSKSSNSNSNNNRSSNNYYNNYNNNNYNNSFRLTQDISQIIAVHIGSNSITYYTNFISYLLNMNNKNNNKIQNNILDNSPLLDFWYKIDLHINWNFKFYDILLNDLLIIENQSFNALSFDGFKLSLDRDVRTYRIYYVY